MYNNIIGSSKIANNNMPNLIQKSIILSIFVYLTAITIYLKIVETHLLKSN
jgi:hypothetical protein